MNNLCSSIEEQLVLGQDRESIDLVNNELLDNLKSQCSFKGNALRVAESLIAAYCRENEELKEENKQLRARLKAVGETKMYALQKELLKSTMRVN